MTYPQPGRADHSHGGDHRNHRNHRDLQDGGDSPDDREPASGVHVQAGGDQTITDSVVAGGDAYVDQHVDQRRRNIRIGIGGGVLVLLLVGGGYGGYRAYRGTANGTVSQSGVTGAARTAARIRQAELDGNADEWCFLASARSGATCRTLMANSFSLPSNCRKLISDVDLGTATGNDSTVQIPILVHNRQIGVLPMERTGGRWQLSSSVYVLAVNNGGMLASAVESTTGGSAFLGATSCS